MLYLHDINVGRTMRFPPVRLLVEKLCGDDYSGRTLLVATRWEKEKDQKLLLETQKEALMGRFGVMVVEHYGTKESAWDKGECVEHCQRVTHLPGGLNITDDFKLSSIYLMVQVPE